MRNSQRASLVVATMALLSVAAAAQKKEFRYPVTAGAMISVVNEFGPVTVRPANGAQVVITATSHSSKVEADGYHNGNRVEVRSHVLQSGSADETRVDYDVQVPPGASVNIRSSDGPIAVSGINGDVTCEGVSAPVEVRDGGNGHVHVHTMDGSITLTNLKNAHMEVVTVGGNVTLSSVDGPLVSVSAGKGHVTYDGDFAGGGDYSLSSHSGNIDVTMPAASSVDVSAKSVNGSVADEFQLQPAPHPMFAIAQGKSFAGTANSGASSVKLRSFSGKISVKKK